MCWTTFIFCETTHLLHAVIGCGRRWTEKTTGTSDITEGLEKLPQEVASAPATADTEQAEAAAPDSGSAPAATEPAAAEEGSVDKSAEEKVEEAGALQRISSLPACN